MMRRRLLGNLEEMRSLLALPLVVMAIAGAVASAEAHPHLRFSFRIEPLLEDTRVTGLQVQWELDPIASMLVRRSADLNGNGELDAEELDSFASGNHSLLAPRGYLLQIMRQGEPQPFTVSRALKARVQDGRVTLDFEVRLQSPVEPRSLSVSFFDSTWYVALNAAEPVLAGDTPCHALPRLAQWPTAGWGEQPVSVIDLACAPQGPVRPAAIAIH
jgi:ABC-type uncharacterized transport system substrate-binding protein